ncbi:MAG: ABC transporter permease [Acidobacteriia bacterium]|nr:ABC transporter permease [Terriglobia bacterium]
MEFTLQDLLYTARTLRKTPAFTLAAIATLALGMGANSAIFQLLDAVRLRTLPVAEPQRLARIQIGNGRGFGVSHYPDNLSYPLFEQIREHQQAFSGVLAWDSGYLAERIGTAEQSHPAPVLRVSGEFFSTLGIPPAAGRLFGKEDDQRGCPAPTVVLGYTFWQSEFAGQLSAIGSRVMVDDQPLEIIGVTPAGFSGPEVGPRFDLALPLCSLSILHPRDQPPFERKDYYWLNVMGRLNPGWTLARATEQLQVISPDIMQATVPTGYSRGSMKRYLGFRLTALPGATGVSRLREEYDRSLWLLLGLTGLVLLIACANLANLMLARSGAREREFAVRVALGAGRGRLIRQSLTESLALAASGAVLGLFVAAALSRGILSFLSTRNNPLHLDLVLDWRILTFTAAVASATCILFGLVPALRGSRAQPAAAVKRGGRGLTTDRARFGFQRFLVVVQVSVSLVLVTGALLFVGSFRRLATLDPGFRAEGLLIANFEIPRQAPLLRQLLEEVRSTPQVESAAATTNFLLGGGSWSLGIRTGSGVVKAESKFTWVTPGYFTTVQTPILAGRDFTSYDSETSPKVAVVNQQFAKIFFPGVDVIGKTFRTAPEPHYPEAEYQVVGLIRNTRYFSLQEPEPPMAYGPASQYPPGPAGTMMYIRSGAPLSTVEAAVRRRIAAWRPGTGMQFGVFQQRISDSLVRERLLAALSGFFGALAAVLASIGLYGVLAYHAVRRRNEIGIRVALGATRNQIVGLVLKEAALLVVLGLAIGLACSLAAADAAASLLFGVSARDPWRLGAAAVALAAAAAMGSVLPARRAARLDPMIALRDD